MNRRTAILLATLAATIQGCATNRVATMAKETRSDLFVAVKDGGSIPAVGAAELEIACHFAASKRPAAAPPLHEPILLLNIDGQVLKLSSAPTEDGASYITYNFATKLRITSGYHRIFIAVPKEGAYEDRAVFLQAGSHNTLALLPVYRRPLDGSHRVDNYSIEEGVKGFEVFFNRYEI